MTNSITVTNKEIIFGKNMKMPNIEVKTTEKWGMFFKKNTLKNIKLYSVYRGVCLKKDDYIFKKNKVRYDLTLIYPGTVMKEPIHTAGHFHSLSKNRYPYPEIYQVIQGQALFLLQNKKTHNVIVIKVNEGEKIIIPGEYGHITINNSLKNILLVSNLFTTEAKKSNYTIFKIHNGAIWRPIYKSNKEIEFEKNTKYKNIKSYLTYIDNRTKFPFGINNKKSLYSEFIDYSKKFDFLIHPSKYSNFLNLSYIL